MNEIVDGINRNTKDVVRLQGGFAASKTSEWDSLHWKES